MNGFMAKNPKQLDICLRLLYAEKVSFTVRVIETHKRKIEYTVYAEADQQQISELKEKFRILTS